MQTKAAVLLSLLPVLFFFAFTKLCNEQSSNKINTASRNSEHIFSGDNKKEWHKVDSLENAGLTRSALGIVEQIYKNSLQENNPPQIIKSLIYKLKYVNYTEEDSHKKIINQIKDAIQSSSFPAKPLLKSILADAYWQYYQQNRYRFVNRTETLNFNNDDFETWDLNRLLKEIIFLYKSSLSEPGSLKNTSVSIFDDVLVKAYGRSYLHPTLYDFIANRALDFYMNEEASVTEPVYKFQLNDHEIFSPAQQFVKLNFETQDSLSLKFYAAKILQDLISFHLNDSLKDALIDIDLRRLNFMRSSSVNENKDTLYLQALDNLENRYSQIPFSSMILYNRAEFYLERGDQYNPQSDPQYKNEKKKSFDICNNCIEKYPHTTGAEACAALKSRILQKDLSFDVEFANLIDQPFRALISYKNLNKVYVRIIKWSDSKEKNTANLYNEKLIDYFRDQSPLKEWEINLPDPKDFQMHSVEAAIPKLEAGFYLILLATNKNFQYSKNAVAYAYTQVTNLSYIRRDLTDKVQFVVLDRESGNPLKDVKLSLFQQIYDGKKSQYVYNLIKSGTTNENGIFETEPPVSYYNLQVVLEKNGDRFKSQNFYSYHQNVNRSKTVKTFFFLDRAIYRPGQTIFFKGLMIETDGAKENNIKTNTNTTVTLYDVNNQKISELNLRTNDYGTFDGKFIAPSGVLTGVMSIRNESGSQSFRVEEYKRPQFEVKLNEIKGDYALNDSVNVSGFAKTYSGVNLDNAVVKYRVVRRAVIPYFSWWYPWFYKPDMEITNGVVKTDNEGKFNLNFKLVPDLSYSKKDKPIFYYTIYTDVVDVTGETHSAQSMVSGGYVSLIANVQIPERINKLDTNKFKTISTNLNSQFQSANFNIKVFKLIEPKRIFRKRLWEKPDQFIFTKEEFYNLFPHDIYNDEDKMESWKIGEQMYDTSFITTDSSMLNLKGAFKKFDSGAYILTLNTKDKNGIPIELKKYFILFDPSSNSVPLNTANWFTEIKSYGEPGETAELLIGSSENAKVLYELEYDGKIVFSKWLSLNDEQQKIDIPIKEEYRGNLIAHFISTINNENFYNTSIIKIPWTNKELKIALETFRDKISPGKNEEWKLKITGPSGEKAAAEMLASMYDASLDAFAPNFWNFSAYPTFYYSRISWQSDNCFTNVSSQLYQLNWNEYISMPDMGYDYLNYFGFNMFSFGYSKREGLYYKTSKDQAVLSESIAPLSKGSVAELKVTGNEKMLDQNLIAGQSPKVPEQELQNISARKNLNETAFFYPHLQTDENGEIIFSFTAPEALTRWKFMTFAHTKDLKYGILTKETVTQKELMIQPNPPRFFREGDTIYFTAKVSNLSEKDLSGTAAIRFYNPFNMQPVDSLLGNISSTVNFTIKKNQSAGLSWKVSIPAGMIDAVTYKVAAKAGEFTDGEENVLPVLPNRMLVTESLPLPVKGLSTKTFVFDKLKNNKSTTLSNYKLTLEFTSNPAWYAIQALPYLMEFPYECSEQIFSRFYANSIASHIANSSPKIKAVFESWKNTDKQALLSNLEKSQDLKNVLLEETPWVLNAQNESERKKRVGLLFDIAQMNSELNGAERKLRDNQLGNGGWPWFPGMPENRYITQHIVAGMGHLDLLGIKNIRENNLTWDMIKKAVNYLDTKMNEDYQYLLEHNIDLSKKNIGYIQIHYLYTRSYFLDLPVADKYKKAFDYWKSQAQTYWLSNNKYMQGMIALALFRLNDKSTANAVIKSLKENAVYNDEMGMYFKQENSWYWYEAPIETQALLIEAFEIIANDESSVDLMKIWLLKQKQVQDWRTTKATADACFALLLRGEDWLSENKPATIKIGNQLINQNKLEGSKPEAGTGYFRTSWNQEQIKPEMGEVTITNNNKVVAWGSLYWQYFEQLDKITTSTTALNINKKLFLQQNTSAGPKIIPITEETKLIPGDLIKVRIEIRVDRNMEFVHLKDMRAAGFEPVNVLSRSKYQDGLWYYESTKDASTNFFMDYLPKGTYVFEYELRATYKGSFSNGITTIQSMYAPEFSSHSEGIRVEIN